MKILETALYVDDLPAAYAFYSEVLGLEALSFDPERDAFFRLDDSMLILFRAEKTLVPDAGVPPHGSTGPGHLAFAVSEGELPQWEARLAGHGVEIEMVKRWSNGARSLYFRDPGGNSLELATPSLWGIAVEPGPRAQVTSSG